MSLLAALALAAGIGVQRLAGMFLLGPVIRRRPALSRVADLIPVAVVTAVIMQLGFASGRTLVLDARAVGLAAAAVAVWRRTPLIVVVLVAASSTALVRLAS
ncbi:MAG: AzlD domain-containing protein [Ilumatobacteraceae bacterium]